MKSDKLANLKNIHYHEIPSIDIRSSELRVLHGLHVILTYKNKKELAYHRIFISASFITQLLKYHIDIDSMTKYDLLAFHIFRYVKEQCTFSSHEWRILWRILHKSNKTLSAIQKFVIS